MQTLKNIRLFPIVAAIIALLIIVSDRGSSQESVGGGRAVFPAYGVTNNDTKVIRFGTVVATGTGVVSGVLRMPSIPTNRVMFLDGNSNMVGLSLGANLSSSAGVLSASGSGSSTFAAIPTSGIIGGTNYGWTTNLSSNLMIVLSNLTANQFYYIDLLSAGYTATFSNSAAWYFVDAGQGVYSSAATNGFTHLIVWNDNVSGRTNALLIGPSYTLATDSDVEASTNLLTGVVTIGTSFSSCPLLVTPPFRRNSSRFLYGCSTPASGAAPLVVGSLGGVTTSGTISTNIPATPTTSSYGLIKADLTALVDHNGQKGLLCITNSIFFMSASMSASNSPGTNIVHCGVYASGNNIAESGSRCGWWSQTGGSQYTNWVAGYYDGSSFVNVHTNAATPATKHILSVANTNRSTIVWYMDGTAVASVASTLVAQATTARPLIAVRNTFTPLGTNYLLWDKVELVYEQVGY